MDRGPGPGQSVAVLLLLQALLAGDRAEGRRAGE